MKDAKKQSLATTRWMIPLLVISCSAFTMWLVLRNAPNHQRNKATPNNLSGAVGQKSNLQSNQTSAGSELLAAGQLAFFDGRLEFAETCLRQAVAIAPQDTQHRLWLGRLLFASGRTFEARITWLPLLKTGGIDLLTMPMLGNAEVKFESETQSIRKGLLKDCDTTTRLANASLTLQDRDIEATRKLLAPIRKQENEWSDQFITLWADFLLVSGNIVELEEWLNNTTAQPEFLSPEYLFIKGSSLRQRKQLESAFNIFARSSELDPVHYQTTAQLAEILRIADQTDSAEFFENRARLIKEYESHCRRVHKSDELPTRQQLVAIIDVCSQLFLYREAVAWATVADAINPNEGWTKQTLEKLGNDIKLNDDRISNSSILSQMLNVPKGLIVDERETPTRTDIHDESLSPTIRFVDDATRAGISFVYDNGSRESIPTRFFEFVGGGVAAIDIDSDSYPDLIFTQGGSSPTMGRPGNSIGPDTPEPTDQLFRNRSGIDFANRTTEAGLIDTGYSQGCASDDVNLDGFADLYIANVGHNALFINNGDGTFSKSDWQAPPHWTTSCTIADLSGDGIPDIYDVNHVIPTGIHAEMCTKGDSTFPCDMSRMQPEQDRFWEADGVGGFSDATAKYGFIQQEGIGLGIAVADFDHSGKLSVFVANDARPNFYFTRSTNDPVFRNEAVARGLAFSAEGTSQACMGVAVADTNRDGQLDMFVTNFFADHNTLYQQIEPGFFTDSTAHTGLTAPSYHLLGFGTQFMDADLDGHEDLVITNGDIANLTEANSRRPWKQRPQMLRNVGGTFQEIELSDPGSYFLRPSLGRGLARLDWNRDGLPDFAVSHIGEPAALLTNQSTRLGSSLKIRPIGTTQARIPFGTVFTIFSDDKPTYRQLSTGCGFQSQNEHTLIFGLKKNHKPMTVDTLWGTGASFSFTKTQLNVEFAVLEDGRILELPK